MEIEKKVSKPYSLYPSIVKWVKAKADKLERETGRSVSESAIVTNILEEAMIEDQHVEEIRKRTEPKIKQVARS